MPVEGLRPLGVKVHVEVRSSGDGRRRLGLMARPLVIAGPPVVAISPERAEEVEATLPIDPDAVELIRVTLAASTRVYAARICVLVVGDMVVLRGAVSSPEEASVAAMIAEREVPVVINALQIDQALREGIDDPVPTDQVYPAEGEILLGEVDPLAANRHTMATDLEHALEENEPYDPPDDPHLGGPDREEPEGQPLADLVRIGDEPDPDPLADADWAPPAAADLTMGDLLWAARGGGVLPALDPTACPPPDRPTVDPEPMLPLGLAPTEWEEWSHFPRPLPGEEPGLGAVGEGTQGGGMLAGTPAGPTGALGADTVEDDPTRGRSAGIMSDLGGEPGPPAIQLRRAQIEDTPDEIQVILGLVALEEDAPRRDRPEER